MENIYTLGVGYMRNKIVVLGLLVLISCIFFATSATGSQILDLSAIHLDVPGSSLESNPCISPASFSIQYMSHPPIYINGNMSATAAVEGWAGNGTVSNPYLIEGWSITNRTSILIHIENTVSYFIIRNNNLNGMASDSMGIFLQNVINGKIESNTIHSCKWGIYLNSSTNNILSNNTSYNHRDCGILLGAMSDDNTVRNNACYQNGESGIMLDEVSDNNIVRNNTSYQNGVWGILLDDVNNNIVRNNTSFNNRMNGIRLSGSNQNVVSHNQVYNNDQDGIALYVCSLNTITKNICYQNYHGIGLEESSFNDVTSNSLYQNRGLGLFLASTTNTLVTNNTIFENAGHGLFLDSGSRLNTLKWNNLVKNNLNEVSLSNLPPQAYDDGSNNILIYNFWDEWTGPDLDNDNIVDNPYVIGGHSGNVDLHPMVAPNPTTVHFLNRPRIILPLEGEIFDDIVQIQWTVSVDSFNHHVNYAIFYAESYSSTWIFIIADLMKTSYSWDTTTIPDGQYVLKVVATESTGLTAEAYSNYFQIRDSSSYPSSSSSYPSYPDYLSLLIMMLFIVLILGVIAIVGGGLVLAHSNKNKEVVPFGEKSSVVQEIYGSCPHCGHERIPGSVFCLMCGHRFDLHLTVRFCPNCGQERKPDYLFCLMCGHRFDLGVP
ncbi:MAG: right-handed parallel beta-helix repeat-containing protein [Promethearchaeota archaeon]